MKNYFLLGFLFVTACGYSQLPSKAIDISPLLIGEHIEDATLLNTNGKLVKITELFAKKKTVLVFYRGGWCPYCNRHLQAIAEAESEIIKLGYQIVVISPDSPNELTKTKDQGQFNYVLLSDATGDFSVSMGIAFKAEERHSERLDRYSDGKNTGFLPVPSVFVVDEMGMVLFEYINPNYKQRMNSELLKYVLINL